MFSTTTRLLIRWKDGLISLGGGGKEQFIEIAGIADYAQALKLGGDILDAHKGQRGTTAVTGHVFNGAQQPGDGFYLGDTMDGMRVQSIAIGMDAEAQTVVTPELGDPLALRLEQLDRRIARASAGGTSEWASPYADKQKQGDKTDTTPPEFTFEWTTPAPTGSS